MVGFLKLSDIFPKLVFDDQAAIQQKFDRIVQGSPANPVIFILHKDIEWLYIKVSVPWIDLIKNGIALRCFAMPFLFEIACKDLFYSIFCFVLDPKFTYE